MLTTTALTALRNSIVSMVSSAKVTIGSTDYSATIASKSVNAQGMVDVRLSLSLAGITGGTLNKVRLYDGSNNIVWEKDEDMSVDAAALTLVYRVLISSYYLADTVWASFYVDDRGNLHYTRTENEDISFYIDEDGNLHAVS